jgi:hypothetical protein
MKTQKGLATRLCHCIKHVRKPGRSKKQKKKEEQRAIAICVASVLHSRGRTLKRFRCPSRSRPYLRTQPYPLYSSRSTSSRSTSSRFTSRRAQ